MNKKDFLKYLDNEACERVRIRIVIDNGRVIDIVVQYESLINEKWVAIVRYDCAHGFFHRDILSPNDDKEKHTIVIQNLEDALLYAEQDIKDRWQFYRQRFVKKIKR